jgi:hypothetical protein
VAPLRVAARWCQALSRTLGEVMLVVCTVPPTTWRVKRSAPPLSAISKRLLLPESPNSLRTLVPVEAQKKRVSTVKFELPVTGLAKGCT